MIEIFDSNSKKIMSFDSYDSLMQHIKQIEREKLLDEERPELYSKPWDFVIHPRESLGSIYWRVIKALDILMSNEEQNAYEDGYNLLEVYRGDVKSKTQVVLSPDIDIEDLKESWCQDYCLKNGYTFVDTRH